MMKRTATLALIALLVSTSTAFVITPQQRAAAIRPVTHLYSETLKDQMDKASTTAPSDEVVPFAEQQTKSIATAVEPKDDDNKNLLQKVKDAGLAGVLSYAVWETAFWVLSVPVALVGYQQLTGHWPDLSNQEDLTKLGAEAFAVVNFARLAVPLRLGLALSTTPWVQENIVSRFFDEETNDTEKASSS